jgi:hypothetical protein
MDQANKMQKYNSLVSLVKALTVLARGSQSVYHVSMDNLNSDKYTLEEAIELAKELALKYTTTTCIHLGETHIGDVFASGEYVETETHLDEPPTG